MFFFAFFWSFFHSSIAPVYNIGSVWPPKAITSISTYTIPLTNTFILLSSGATVTWAHHALLVRAKKHTLIALIFTLILAIIFTCFQGLEYISAPFNISDGVYGSCFYLATGFHGFHGAPFNFLKIHRYNLSRLNRIYLVKQLTYLEMKKTKECSMLVKTETIIISINRILVKLYAYVFILRVIWACRAYEVANKNSYFSRLRVERECS